MPTYKAFLDKEGNVAPHILVVDGVTEEDLTTDPALWLKFFARYSVVVFTNFRASERRLALAVNRQGRIIYHPVQLKGASHAHPDLSKGSPDDEVWQEMYMLQDRDEGITEHIDRYWKPAKPGATHISLLKIRSVPSIATATCYHDMVAHLAALLPDENELLRSRQVSTGTTHQTDGKLSAGQVEPDVERVRDGPSVKRDMVGEDVLSGNEFTYLATVEARGTTHVPGLGDKESDDYIAGHWKTVHAGHTYDVPWGPDTVIAWNNGPVAHSSKALQLPEGDKREGLRILVEVVPDETEVKEYRTFANALVPMVR